MDDGSQHSPGSPAGPPDVQRTRSTDGVLEQLERDHVADPQIVERRAFLHIRTMEEDVALVREADEAMALPDQQLGNSAGGMLAVTLGWSWYFSGAHGRRSFADHTVKVFAAHVGLGRSPRAYQRGSDRRRREWSPPPKPPPPCAGFGRASLTVRPRPPIWYAFNSVIARCASSSVLISTNANPRARPVAMSRITLTVSTVPARAKSSWSSVSPVSYGRFPTYNFRPIN